MQPFHIYLNPQQHFTTVHLKSSLMQFDYVTNIKISFVIFTFVIKCRHAENC